MVVGLGAGEETGWRTAVPKAGLRFCGSCFRYTPLALFHPEKLSAFLTAVIARAWGKNTFLNK